MNKNQVLFEYNLRGGNHCNERVDFMEGDVAKVALQDFMTIPAYFEKGLRWAYNFTHFRMLYGNCDPKVLDYLHEVRPYPDYLEIEPTTVCNFKCRMCEHTHWKEKGRHMTYDEFLKIMRCFPNLKWLGVTGIGSSLTNKDWLKMVRYAKSKGIYIEMFDRFLILTPNIVDELVSWGIDRMYVSLDAASQETLDIMCPGMKLDAILRNVKSVEEAKKRRGTRFPFFNFHFIITKDNIHELKAYVKMVHDLSMEVQSIQFSRLLHNFPAIEKEFVEISDELKDEIVRYGESLGINCTWNINAQLNPRPFSDCSVWYQPFIFSDGTVIPCCSLNEQNDRPWQVRTSLGNIYKDDFRKIWYGPNYTHMLAAIRKNKWCDTCERCILFKPNGKYEGGRK